MKQKHTLVIGGTRGIGRAAVRAFINEGHILSVIGRHEVAEKDKELQNASYWIVDLSNSNSLSQSLTEILDKNGKLTNLIFCQRYKGNQDPWSGEIEISLTASKNIIENLRDKFDGTHQNSIVIITSAASRYISQEQPIGYHVAKAGIKQLVRYYAVALGPNGIHVNSVSPITILKEESKHFYVQNEQMMDLYKTIVPLGRMGTAEEIAQVIVFLCSPKASYITGQDIIVDGGISLHNHESLARKLTSLRHDNVQKERITQNEKSSN